METARRAVEIAAAGGHNLLLIGPPGAGKSMLAARLPGLLPDLAPREALEVSMIHSVAGMLEGGRLVMRPPFREPHHSASQAALTGGGQRARPGEVSLAHRGVLFLDELPEFPRPALDSLRQPMETGRTTVSRAVAHITYPGAVPIGRRDEPLPLRLSRRRRARMRPRAALRRGLPEPVSGPVLDRMDLTVEVQPASAAELAARAARRGQRGGRRRGLPTPARRNGRATARTGRYAMPRSRCGGPAGAGRAGSWRSQAMDRLRLSPRGYTRVLRVARTIADLAGAERWGGCMSPRHWRSATASRGGRSDGACHEKLPDDPPPTCWSCSFFGSGIAVRYIAGGHPLHCQRRAIGVTLPVGNRQEKDRRCSSR